MSQIVPSDDDINTQHSKLEIDDAKGLLEIGQWYWVQDTDRENKPYEWLGCVTYIGSNFVEMNSPKSRDLGYSSVRVHFNDFLKTLRFEPNAPTVIKDRVQHYQALAAEHMNEVKKITAQLGVSTQLKIDNADERQSTALATMSGQGDIKDYETSLVLAKEKLLPDLFKEIKTTHQHIAKWMTAETLPMEAMVKQMEGSIKEIDTRIFNVSLYAGLTEHIALCKDGKPADFNEKLRVMQRRLYMDEECLLNYEHGGMEFRNILKFDEWLSREENMNRVLPFERCMVSMRVRRNKKARDVSDLRDAMINFQLEQEDKRTFLYIRNGEQLHRMECDLDFGDMMFPDKSLYDGGELLMYKTFGSKIDEFMSVREYDHRVAEKNRNIALYDQWELDNPAPRKEGLDDDWEDSKQSGRYNHKNPYYREILFADWEWKPVNQDSVMFDDCMSRIEAEINQYNRIAFIIQGLFDRSPVLHPHPPVKTWDPMSFYQRVELIFDSAMVLTYGEPADFEAYRAKLNAEITKDSVMVGQELYWLKKEAVKESARMDRDYRNKSDYRPKTYRPYGNPGPGYVAHMRDFKPKSGMATFSWYRDRIHYQYGDDENILTTVTVPVSELLNISAYKMGDYKQFFNDPRTRAEYLKWAPMLIAAEDYHAGKRAAKTPV